MKEFWALVLLVIVSILWGVTNPLLKRASVGIENVKADNLFYQTIAEVTYLASKFSYVAPFLLNQIGGVLFVYSLGLSDLSLAVPFTNSLTFIITTLTGHLLGEEKISSSVWIGAALVCAGISLCIADKALP
ncbi:Transmembrane protein [Armadillidium nasatum]|uniref:Transmembrane protein n=1 Tax=Armadillidium nasatum TaxID=96803 RepID=A0A5N5SVM7_9CRUS|nr:Transmembrane protein [Armadillidium nasatum]